MDRYDLMYELDLRIKMERYRDALRDIAGSEPIPDVKQAYEFCVAVAAEALQD